jgi:hypothetical protein
MSNTPSISPGAASPSDPNTVLQQLIAQQQQQQQAIQALMAQQQQGNPPQPALDISGLANLLVQQQQAMQQQQLQATAQMMSLQALGPLPTFAGSGAVTSLEAVAWLEQAERYFTAREAALGITAQQGDAIRVTLAANAFPLKSVAQQWYSSLPSGDRPTTWAAFRAALLGRFCSVPNVRVRIEQLRSFVDAARRLRDKMTLEGLQGFTARFQQLSGEIPDSHLTAHGKLELLARGLPARLAEVVLAEDAKDTPSALHEVVKRVLAKAAFKEYAAGYSGSSATSSAASPMELDAISLCAAQFGIPLEEARRYLEPQEGWSSHETNSGEGPGALAAAAAAASPPARQSGATDDATMERLLAAFESRFGKAASGSNKAQSQRRNVPSDVSKEIPQDLAAARKQAGLCIKCGVTKYEPGGKGHNSRTCTLPINKSISAVEGRKKANF